MVDVNKQIRLAVKTGKVEFGSKTVSSNVSHARAKLVILAHNCAEETRDEIVYQAGLSEIPVFVFQGSSLDLGALCERPFPVSAMIVREPGDSEVLKLAEIK